MQTEEITTYKDYIRRSLEEWRTLDDEDIQMDKFFSRSNFVYKATANKDVQPKAVVFKKTVSVSILKGLCKASFGCLDLEDDSRVTKEVSNKGFGPKLLAEDGDFRILEYVNAQKMVYDDLSRIQVRRWHVLAVANFNKLKVEGFNKKKAPFDSEANLSQYLQHVEQMFASKKFPPEGSDIISEAKKIASRENAEFLRKLILKDDEEIVLCQGDQNFNNVLVSKENDKVTLVDYELSSHSFKGDDIGCFLFHTIIDVFYPEPPLVKVYGENYPSEELFRELAEYYVVFFDMDDKTMKVQGEKMVFDKNLLDEYVKESYQKEEFEVEVKKMVQNFKLAICSTALWIINLVLSSNPNDIFTIKACYELFLRAKDNYLKDSL